MNDDLAALPLRMTRAWNDGDASAFAADFGPGSQLVEFDGEVITGRDELVRSQQPLFDGVLKDSRLVDGRVLAADVIAPGVGVVRYRASLLMRGETEAPVSRESMQTIVAVLREGRWEILLLQNARVLSVEDAVRLER